MQNPSFVLCVELDSSHLTAIVTDTVASKTVCEYGIELETAGTLLDESHQYRQPSDDGSRALIRCIAKGLDQLFEGLHLSSPSTIGKIKAVVVISDSTALAEVDHTFGTFLTALDPLDRLEHQILDFQTWQSAKSRAPFDSSFAIPSTVSSQSISVATLVESFIAGASLPYNIVQAAHCNLFSPDQLERRGGISDVNGTRPIGAWIIHRFGADPQCLICSSLPAHLAAYMSFFPNSEEGGLSFGRSDYMIVPSDKRLDSTIHSDKWIPNPLYLLNMHGPSTSTSHKPWLMIVKLGDAGHVRDVIRKTYTKTWNAFDQLIYAVCPGGSFGLDNKFFSFYTPKEGAIGIHRYENGTQTSEFSDLRANPRCIVESQAMTLRGRLSQMQANGKQSNGYTGAAGCLGFNPRDKSLLLSSWYAWGDIVTDGIMETYSQVLGAPIYTFRRSEEPEGTGEIVSRGTIGATYYATYLLHQHKYPASPLSFRDCIQSPVRDTFPFNLQRNKSRRKSFLPIVQEGDTDSEQGTIIDSYTRPLNTCPVTQRVRSCTITPISTWDGSNMRQCISSPTQISSPIESSYREVLKVLPSRLKRFQSDSALRGTTGDVSEGLIKDGLEEVNQEKLIKIGEPDDDLWEFYAALLEEHLRLSSMVEHTQKNTRN